MFDYIILGSGPGGLTLAYKLKDRGFSVAVVENDKWGGTCPNYGCDPTKAMMAVVEAKHHADQLKGQGLNGGLTVDWETMRQRKLDITDPYAEQSLEGLKKSGIEAIYGTGKFMKTGEVEVAGKVYSAKKYIIATGTRARHLDIEGGEFLSTSNDFLNLEKLPKNITFLGTGPIGLELAQLAKAAGAQVTVIAVGDLGIMHFDKEIGDAYLSQLQSLGIEFKANISVQKVKKLDEGLVLSDEQGFELQTDFVVAGVGRVPNVNMLNLEAVGVETNRGGVIVNEFLQSSNPNIYAIGDVIAKFIGHLTPVSVFEGNYLGENLDSADAKAIAYPVIPAVIYGSTKMAEVGRLTGDDVTVKLLDTKSWFTYQRLADPVAKIKVAVNDKKEIVGASIISGVADELVNFMTILIQQKITLNAMSSMIMAYPTVASDLGYFY